MQEQGGDGRLTSTARSDEREFLSGVDRKRNIFEYGGFGPGGIVKANVLKTQTRFYRLTDNVIVRIEADLFSPLVQNFENPFAGPDGFLNICVQFREGSHRSGHEHGIQNISSEISNRNFPGKNQ